MPARPADVHIPANAAEQTHAPHLANDRGHLVDVLVLDDQRQPHFGDDQAAGLRRIILLVFGDRPEHALDVVQHEIAIAGIGERLDNRARYAHDGYMP